MFVLKPDNSQGRFVSNLRTTICVLKNSCKLVPKTAFKRPITSVAIHRTPTSNAVYELDLDVEECVLLDDLESKFD
jgi:hypothetical protein